MDPWFCWGGLAIRSPGSKYDRLASLEYSSRFECDHDYSERHKLSVLWCRVQLFMSFCHTGITIARIVGSYLNTHSNISTHRARGRVPRRAWSIQTAPNHSTRGRQRSRTKCTRRSKAPSGRRTETHRTYTFRTYHRTVTIKRLPMSLTIAHYWHLLAQRSRSQFSVSPWNFRRIVRALLWPTNKIEMSRVWPCSPFSERAQQSRRVTQLRNKSRRERRNRRSCTGNCTGQKLWSLTKNRHRCTAFRQSPTSQCPCSRPYSSLRLQFYDSLILCYGFKLQKSGETWRVANMIGKSTNREVTATLDSRVWYWNDLGL